MSDEPFMSSDGEDSDGSLCEFIMGSEDEGEEPEPAVNNEPEDEACALAQELTAEERALMEEKQEEGAPRRSRRARKAVVRYVDDKYAELMLTRGGVADLDDVMAPSSDDEAAAESDDDFEIGDSEDESDGESEDEADDKTPPEEASGKRSVTGNTTEPRKRARTNDE